MCQDAGDSGRNRKEVIGMVMFVGQDKMTPVQLALETARFKFSHLHGSTVIHKGSNDSYVFDSTEVNECINAALEYLAKSSEPSTCP